MLGERATGADSKAQVEEKNSKIMEYIEQEEIKKGGNISGEMQETLKDRCFKGMMMEVLTRLGVEQGPKNPIQC